MNTYPFSPKLRPTLWDGVVAALWPLWPSVTALCFYGRRTGAPQAVTITHRGALIQTIRLTGPDGNKNRHHRRRLPSGNSGGQRRRLRCPQRLSGAGLRSHRPHHPFRPRASSCLPEQVVIQLTGGTSDADVVLGIGGGA